jgi:hypothetical protein
MLSRRAAAGRFESRVRTGTPARSGSDVRSLAIHAAEGAEPMTIPDLGHCVGSGAPPVEGSERDESHEEKTGICPACSGRFELHPTGVVALHDAADVEDRESWPEGRDVQ